MQLLNTNNKQKPGLDWTIQGRSIKERTFNSLLSGKNVRFSSILASLEVLGLSISINTA